MCLVNSAVMLTSQGDQLRVETLRKNIRRAVNALTTETVLVEYVNMFTVK
jgi:hypothetical protein